METRAAGGEELFPQLAAQFLYLNRLSPTTGRTTVLARGTHHAYSRTDYGSEKKTIVRVCLVKELGHAWSGGNGDIRFHDSTGPDASALMWRFFTTHRRRAKLPDTGLEGGKGRVQTV